MAVRQLKQSLQRLQETLIRRSYYADKDAKGFRTKNYSAQIASTLKSLEDQLWTSVGEIDTKERRLELFVLYDSLKKTQDVRSMLLILSRMDELLREIKDKDDLKFNVSRIPEEVKEEVMVDLDELRKCYDTKCYRSCIIICGRLLEVALHRKYYETTGIDILEKHPDVGLGNLIAKLVEKEVHLGPGLTQQIHFINNVRISSVHKKKQVFLPSKAQANATILFTLDTLEKLF
ncbi:MAG: hypothetical protein QT08_C0008G0014 [archaeon GW2011_AR17]|nr:MAG: hypothetical protein QT08_C0008G0014 [archaeon GW2011_AR17]MBS3153778.1 hypothetical protein [Candidatus Woesearchaeota archaeon]HIH15196.1 hypothetical protein [Nanoarchaeota archaeon]HIH59462.1 hypothetical protein [Nanoarchaeota archaeon]HII13860.1 hypothetical protein [Nanoarchaeota archaeon]